MLNKEKYAKEIIDIACNGDSVGMRNGILCSCDTINNCKHCDFYNEEILCEEVIKEWANSEYKEREIDWNKVPVDTPIYVWDSCYKNKTPRHFASFKNNTNTIAAFNSGQTSWTVDDNKYDVSCWKHAEIKEGVDCSEWYKD